jgi:demethylmenaquinone methyltransferase/2-methoxy-6-polyprenyl-1,4-benzoquinol methylase
MTESGNGKRRFVKGIFDSIAPGYDRANRLMSLGRDRRWRSLVAARCALPPGGHALDLCCGTGELTLALAASAPGARVTGLDLSGEMLALARRKVAELDGSPERDDEARLPGHHAKRSINSDAKGRINTDAKGRIDFVEADATRLPFPDDSFDAVTVGWGLRNVPDLAATLREMARVLKPGGVMVSIDMGHPLSPLVSSVYWFVSKRFVPTVGRVVARNEEAYRYLHDSARGFIDQRELASRFAALGLSAVRVRNFLGGAVALVEGRKPALVSHDPSPSSPL